MQFIKPHARKCNNKDCAKYAISWLQLHNGPQNMQFMSLAAIRWREFIHFWFHWVVVNDMVMILITIMILMISRIPLMMRVIESLFTFDFIAWWIWHAAFTTSGASAFWDWPQRFGYQLIRTLPAHSYPHIQNSYPHIQTQHTHTLIPPNAHTHGHTHKNDKHEQNKDDKGVKVRNRIAMRCDRASVAQRTGVLHKGREAQSLV